MAKKLALCPFYRFEKKSTLYCELRNVCFPNRQERNIWMSTHCNAWTFKLCKLYDELMKKYE